MDPSVIANPSFAFSDSGSKVMHITKYLDLMKAQDKTREAISLLESSTDSHEVFSRLTCDLSVFMQLVEELDGDHSIADLKLGN